MLDYTAEQTRIAAGFPVVAGIDEAGRGPWAGPVVAAAVVLNPLGLPQGLRDSKKLSAARRETLFTFLSTHAHVGVGQASVAEIDSLNIREATFLAMRRAVLQLQQAMGQPVNYVFVDGNVLPSGLPAGEWVVKGDDKILSVAAASVVAKVTRDRLMTTLHQQFPHYGWHNNAGYGTKSHQQGIATFGITPHHRQSFAPIKTHIALVGGGG